MHNAFLNIDNRKMSKSLGNFFTVREVGEEYDLQVLRFFMLSAHYRSPLNFSRDLMAAAKNGLERIRTAAEHLRQRKEQGVKGPMTQEEETLAGQAGEFVDKFQEAMDDDFNTADAISVIFELVKFANTHVTEDSTCAFAEKLYGVLGQLSDIMGLVLEQEEELLDEEIEELIALRQSARKAKDYQKADEIRQTLLEKGILLEDTREGVKWKKA